MEEQAFDNLPMGLQGDMGLRRIGVVIKTLKLAKRYAVFMRTVVGLFSLMTTAYAETGKRDL